MTTEGRIEAQEELREIADEMRELLDRAHSALEMAGGLEERRARAYWYASMRINLGGEHDFMGGSMCSLEDTIKELALEDPE